ARDGAYHQGTVWPWLIGPYADACLAVRGDIATTRWEIVQKLRPLCEFFLGPGNGQLPEIFDGDAPHRPNGCPAQAWSVAELLRILTRLGTP
ncbi:MAG TPA: amylo-alpha-1,6-glucosidase, partial [Thermoanaerobaculia bacterium]|nr:amylo-alpha-1,6-glucosidase [Thermoanaerobaculia bacterium]